MAELIQPVKGMNDVLPEQAPWWNRLESVAHELFASYGYQRVRLPVLERTELFSRSIGELTDIVSKEMFTFDDHGDSLTLRPEGDGRRRARGVEQRLAAQPAAEALVVGADVPAREAAEGPLSTVSPDERRGARLRRRRDRRRADRVVRAPVARARFDQRGLELNTIGTAESRQKYKQVLVEHFSRRRELLDEDSLRRLDRNPLRILDSKNPQLRELIDAAPLLSDYLDAESRAHFERVRALLDDVGVGYTLNPRLVRGLDYYSRTVFEWVTDRLGAQSAVCSGGRYDGLVAQLGGRDTPAVGWALGIERIVELMQAEGIGADEAPVGCPARRGRRGRAAVRLQARGAAARAAARRQGLDRHAVCGLQSPAAPCRQEWSAVCADHRGIRACGR